MNVCNRWRAVGQRGCCWRPRNDRSRTSETACGRIQSGTAPKLYSCSLLLWSDVFTQPRWKLGVASVWHRCLVCAHPRHNPPPARVQAHSQESRVRLLRLAWTLGHQRLRIRLRAAGRNRCAMGLILYQALKRTTLARQGRPSLAMTDGTAFGRGQSF